MKPFLVRRALISLAVIAGISFAWHLSPPVMAQTNMQVYIYDRFKTESIINKLCDSRWPADHRMQSHCKNESWQALDQLGRASPGLGTDGLNGEEFEAVRKRCGLKWEPDFKMWAYCESQQREAALAIKIRDPADVPRQHFRAIRTLCEEKWRGDYVMRNHCEIGTVENLRKRQQGG